MPSISAEKLARFAASRDRKAPKHMLVPYDLAIRLKDYIQQELELDWDECDGKSYGSCLCEFVTYVDTKIDKYLDRVSYDLPGDVSYDANDPNLDATDDM